MRKAFWKQCRRDQIRVAQLPVGSELLFFTAAAALLPPRIRCLLQKAEWRPILPTASSFLLSCIHHLLHSSDLHGLLWRTQLSHLRCCLFVCLFWYIIRLAGPGWKSRGHQADSTTPRREDTVSSIPPQPDKPNNTDHRWERWSSFREQYWEDPSPSVFFTLLLDGDYPKSSSGCNGDVQCLVLNITGNIFNLREYSSYKFHNGRCRLRAA